MIKQCITFLLISISFQSFTQNYYSKQFNYLNGLPTMNVYNVFCAHDGFLWIGSVIGLIRYDGVAFETFSTEDGLPDTEVILVFGDNQNRIWGITFNGKIFFIKDNIVYNETNSPLLAELNNNYKLSNFLITVSNDLYLYSPYDIVRIEEETIKKIDFKYDKKCNPVSGLFELDNKIYFSVLCDETRIVYVLKNDVAEINSDEIIVPLIYSYTNANDEYYYITDKGIISNTISNLIVPLNFNPKLNQIPYLFVDSNNDCWYFDLNKGIQYIHNGVFTTLLSEYKINSIDQDFEGNFWISTISNGIFVFYADFFNKKQIFSDNEAELLSINCLYIDSADNIWAGNSFANVTMIDNKDEKRNFKLIDINKYARIIDFDVAGNSLLVASDEGVYQINRKEKTLISGSIGGRTVKSISVLNEKEFAAAYSYGVSIFRFKKNIWTEEKIFSKRSFSVQYNNDLLWFSAESGTYTYKDSIRRINVAELDGKRILDFAFYEKENLVLISTDGYGIYAIDEKDYSILWHAHSQNGLTTNLTRHLQLIGDTLWINSASGLNRLIISKKGFQKLQPLTSSNGLPADDIKDFYIKGNSLVIAGNFGAFQWKNFIAPVNLPAPKFHILNIITDMGKFRGNDKIISEYNNGFIKIHYSAIRYASTVPLVEYSIDNGNWLSAAVGLLELNGLSPGLHHLQFRLMNGDIIPLPDNSLTIFIEAPFYSQQWFIPLLIGIIAMLISSVIIFRINKAKHKAVVQLKLSEDLAFAEQQALQAMMNPHFIFNAVNSVQQYIIRNDKKEANKYLTQFARLIRLNLETSKNKYIALEEEIERLSLYLQFEKVRFGDKLEYSITVSPELETDKLFIPTMIIQPFVENAIWHGLIPKAENGHVNISIEKKDLNIIIRILDDGVGYILNQATETNSIKTSMGSIITKRRLELLEKQTGKPHFFTISSAQKNNQNVEGTLVTITLPLKSDSV
ncbi:MAG: histidine kinase [Bacteroidetes bacterium]|nr:histidine kinase [Bacteroidota bacterium]